MDQIQTLFHAAPDAVIVIDEAGNIVNWNPRAEALFGWTAPEVMGKPLNDTIIPHRYRAAHQEGLKRFLQTGEAKVLGRTIEIQAINKSAREFDVALSIAPSVSNGKHFFIGFIRDITLQKKAEQEIMQLNSALEQRVAERTHELYKSEQKYRHLFENNPMPMWVIDIATFRFLDVNEAAIAHYGYSREEFLSMTALNIRPPQEVVAFKQAHHPPSINPRQYNRGLWKHQKKDGTVIDVEIIAHDIVFEGLTARMILSNDVTARIRAEEALRESQQLLMAIVDNSEAVIYVKKLDGRYLMVNRRFREIFKLTNEDIIGKTDYDLFPREVASALRQVDEQAAISDHPLTEEEIVPQEDGMHTYISVKSKLPDATGKPHATFGISTDITKLKAVEAELHKLNEELELRVEQRTTQLEAVNRELEAFSYSVSHDLRAPLRGIIGFTTMLEEDYSSQLDEEARRITSIIKDNTLKMGHLIDGLLTFSRMTRQDIVKTHIDTGKMVNDIIETLRPGKAVDWNIHSLPPVKGDFNTLRQVWINLLSNAVKYSGNKEYPQVEIGSFTENGQTIFFVKDNGVGFDNKYKDKLFRVFQRLHSYDEFEGTGVGLALVEKIISKHGGKVWADAVINEGATFYFSLPADSMNQHLN
jgi:PAS domain S-box-containing protein